MRLNRLLSIGVITIILVISIALIRREPALITIDEAATTAEFLFLDAEAIEVDLKTKRGEKVYKVKLNNGMAVRVNAKDGTIQKIDRYFNK